MVSMVATFAVLTHVCRLASQAQPANNLVTKVSALGNSFEVVLQALLEVLLGPLFLLIFGSKKVPFGDSHTLKAAAKKVELLVHVLGIIFMILFPSHQELRFEVQNGVGQRIFGAESGSVGCDFAGHLSSVGCGP